MRLLLDTHVFLWILKNDPRLSDGIKNKIMNAAEVYISSVSIWEIAIKVKIGKLQADVDEVLAAIDESGFAELPLTATHVAGIAQLPVLHRDPFDRVLIAQAISEPLKLLTTDSALKQYSDLVELI